MLLSLLLSNNYKHYRLLYSIHNFTKLLWFVYYYQIKTLLLPPSKVPGRLPRGLPQLLRASLHGGSTGEVLHIHRPAREGARPPAGPSAKP